MKKSNAVHQVKHKQSTHYVQPRAGDDAQTLAAKQASNLTGIPLSKLGPGKHPVVGSRKTTPKSGKKR